MLATGDSDFGPVFRRLRELGKGVVGVGPSSVLSSSVTLSCHDFILTDDDSKRSGSAKKGRGKGARGERAAAGAGPGTGGRGKLCARVATPSQLLLTRGGFRFQRQSAANDGVWGGGFGAAATGGAHAAEYAERGIATSPLLIGGPPPPPAAAVGAVPTTYGNVDWTAMSAPFTPPPPLSPPPPPPSSSRLDLSSAFARVALEDAASPSAASVEPPVLSPGQLLLPGMVTAAAATAAASSPAVSPRPARSEEPLLHAGRDTRRRTETMSDARDYSSLQTAGGVFNGGRGGGSGGDHGGSSKGRGAWTGPPTSPLPPPLPPAFDGLGALSVIRPSEKVYRHLLALEASGAEVGGSGGGGSSLASDWGNGLSEITVAKGLVSLAEACGGQDNSEHSRAVEALGGFSTKSDGGGGEAGDGGGLGREEAFRVASLLQRCGFLSWMAKEQQWVVTVPADVEVLRRRRDEAMMEELLTRCQEAGVPFEPSLATNLLWSKAR